jgi:hypothetical protein
MITALLQFILLTLAVYLLLLGYTRFTCCHRKVVDHGKPGGQRQLGGMKDRPGDQRHLMAARRALVDRAGLEHDRVGSSAFRADETPRPAPREQRRPALLLGAILRPKRRFAQALLELHNVLGHPNLLQSLDSMKLHHPLRKLKFVGNQERIWRRVNSGRTDLFDKPSVT